MIYSFVAKRIEDGCWTGVARFDSMLRRVFPDMTSTAEMFVLNAGDVVITDNHLSLRIPRGIRTIVVHHGCAATHYRRDPNWHTPLSRAMVAGQDRMMQIPDRIYVAPSAWVRKQFDHNGHLCPVIPYWVESIPCLDKAGRPRIIGDWRDSNKGSGLWGKLALRCPQWEFQPLNFRDDEGRRKQYGEASLYLCLSLSEGGAYAVCDAEAAGLPIVTTNVGNYLEFSDCEVIDWKYRDNLDLVVAAIDRKLKAGRAKPSYYQDYTFDVWRGKWEALVQ